MTVVFIFRSVQGICTGKESRYQFGKRFYLLIGGSELYYDIKPSFGDFQYAQCSDIAGDKSMYCTVGRIPGRNIAEIEAVCNNVLRCGSIQKDN